MSSRVSHGVSAGLLAAAFAGSAGGVESLELGEQPPWSERRAGEYFRDCDECPEMVVVPAGEFVMGSPSSEEGRYRDEGPLRRVRIGSPFAVGVREVTFAEWEACASAGGCGRMSRWEALWLGLDWDACASRRRVRWLSAA